MRILLSDELHDLVTDISHADKRALEDGYEAGHAIGWSCEKRSILDEAALLKECVPSSQFLKMLSPLTT